MQVAGDEHEAMAYGDWMAAAAEEYRRLDVLLRGLGPDDWAAPTDCPGWDVRAMVAHLVGAAESNASVRELLRQARLARALGREGDLVDRMNAVQVREREGVRLPNSWPTSRRPARGGFVHGGGSPDRCVRCGCPSARHSGRARWAT